MKYFCCSDEMENIIKDSVGDKISYNILKQNNPERRKDRLLILIII